MSKRIILIISCLALLSIPFFIGQKNGVDAQTKNDDDLFLNGSIENDRRMTGFYSKDSNAAQNKDWCVFIGENGKVYKIWLIDRSIHTLHIDGQKIADDQIWKHTAEYKPFLLKMWHINDLEKKSSQLDDEIRPVERKISALEKELEKLDKKQEQIEKSSSSFTDSRTSIDAEMRKLAKMIEERSKEIEELSQKQEALSKEMEANNLMGEMDKVFRQISADLQSLGVIKNSANLSFKLSNSELIVNGKKVSAEVFELLKARYIVEMKGNFGFIYRWKGEV